jgi:hypothetical protein
LCRFQVKWYDISSFFASIYRRIVPKLPNKTTTAAVFDAFITASNLQKSTSLNTACGATLDMTTLPNARRYLCHYLAYEFIGQAKAFGLDVSCASPSKDVAMCKSFCDSFVKATNDKITAECNANATIIAAVTINSFALIRD